MITAKRLLDLIRGDPQRQAGCAFVAGLVAVLVYWPGLDSGFLFDDHSNLGLLAKYGRVDDWRSLWLYLLSGFSGPTGRPVSYLSFLIDANHWPADPWPFKRTNLIIHLVNGAVLLGLLRQCALAAGLSRRRAGWAALSGAALWLLHPFWVSTTLYAVQRMTMLAAMFVLLGLWGWIHLRLRHGPAYCHRWLVGGVLSVWGAGLLAVLSKENGALLPALILVLEVTLLAAMDQRIGQTPGRGFRRLRLILLGVPLAGIGLYLLGPLSSLLEGGNGSREFTQWQRLLTQGRILWEYIYHLAVPQRFPGGLFNDGLTISTGLFTPWTTAVAWAAWGGVVAAAWRYRRMYPSAAAAALFFLAAHALESTLINLELYFEHRNYLPAALLPLPLATAWLSWQRIPRDARIAVPVALLALLAVMTLYRAELWSKPFQQALKWAQVNPESPRAQHRLASFWHETGHLAEARRLNQAAIALDPDGLAWLITSVGYACAEGEAIAGRLERVEQVLAEREALSSVAVHQTRQMFRFTARTECADLSTAAERLALIERLQSAQASQTNEAFAGLLAYRRARIELGNEQPEAAHETLQRLISQTSDPATQLRAASVLAVEGHHEQALAILSKAVTLQPPERRWSKDWVRYWYLEQTEYYAKERERLRERIRDHADDLSERQRREERASPHRSEPPPAGEAR